ncbi:copper homeostasis protein CutC [Lentiprolixibacter aurantiacus]|uniref:PF03932 family protein CutC n=1 Tax=Lentiprolixibacter aurantiacus TaxID=2993939 RepID=A0AAE3SMT0_9FLAO|nr:copper homeostasis protein CutC [Lentiprolixibacter aurantiacus]MCX2719007.1 copper homeostasis protein CutC [Lentiprolixibacter aurantiacus]
MIVEVCAASLDSALSAGRAGADRIELCSELGVGGITPSMGLFKEVKARTSLPVHVLIRPRSGDFAYTEAEFEVILADIALFKSSGAEGIVCGILQKDHVLDTDRTEKVLEASEGLSFTFHRAFDWVPDPMQTFQTLQDMGVNTLLSSGKAKGAPMGLPLLKKMHKCSRATTVMPGAGIRPNNIRQFIEAGFKALHLSGAVMQNNSEPHHGISLMGGGLLSETDIATADYEVLRAVVQSVKE